MAELQKVLKENNIPGFDFNFDNIIGSSNLFKVLKRGLAAENT